jgi:quercetin dioxygenase-like cupin family protein
VDTLGFFFGAIMKLSSSHLFSFGLGAVSMTFIAAANADDEPPTKPEIAPHKVVRVSDAVTRTSPSGKATIKYFAGQEDGAKNAFFGLIEIAPGAKVPTHRDATEEYIFFADGEGVLTIDGTTHEVRGGTGVFMPANAEVSFEATGSKPVMAVQFFAGQGPEAKYDGWAIER